ncbi:MAG: glycerophosphoryl diester phosphodiesterase, partial [Frankiales bacterium]|nr:glycerophosphoryl diester phosphodiesterase [Frankiales bacterium]
MTLVVAHRGASGDHAEHTLTACEKAVVDGADALECDVRLTRDGVLVCVHDRRVDRTSDGRGVVSTLELSELSELDFASWKQRDHDPLLEASWEEPDTDGSTVLTLERLLQLALDS